MTATKEWIDLLIENAPKLREAGVLTLAIGDAQATLARHELELPAATPQPQIRDPLEDPDTYGGGVVPGYQRPDDEVDEADAAPPPRSRGRRRRS